jgi:hypothetical protein
MTQSKRTGGPKTAAGKMASAQNAIKTGAYSSLIILPGESEEDFRELEERFVRDFSPEDVVASTMVHTLTVLTWKKLRAQKIEHAGLIRTLAAKFDITDYIRVSFPSAITDAGQVLTVVDAMSQAEEAEWISAFAFCKQFIKAVPSEQQLKALKLSSSLLYAHLETKAVAIGRHDCRLWPTMTVTTLGGKVHSFINYYCESFLEDYQIAELAVEHIVRLRQIVKEIKEARLLKFLQQNSIQRVHDDLDRAFYRTLSELRKHQHWRQERNTVDVTSEE